MALSPAPLQMGVARGLFELDLDYYQRISREYKGKRDRICAALEKGGCNPYIPQGAYYVLADISGLPGKTARNVPCIFLTRSVWYTFLVKLFTTKESHLYTFSHKRD